MFFFLGAGADCGAGDGDGVPPRKLGSLTRREFAFGCAGAMIISYLGVVDNLGGALDNLKIPCLAGRLDCAPACSIDANKASESR